jgi:hypothetical protein
VIVQLYALVLACFTGCENTPKSPGERCGSAVCGESEICCSPMCGTCAARASDCVLACQAPGEPAPDAQVPESGNEEALCAKMACDKGLHCKAQNGAAVCLADTPEQPPKQASCDNVHCDSGRHCEVRTDTCDAGECDPVALCLDNADNECAGVECQVGEVCSPLHHVPRCIPEAEARPCNLQPCDDFEYCDDSSGTPTCTKQPDCEGVSCEPGSICRVTSSEQGCDTLPCVDRVACAPCMVDDEHACLQFPCTNTRCDAGYFCQEIDQVAHCVKSEDVCLTTVCDKGYHCIPHTVECFLPPCSVVPECVPD